MQQSVGATRLDLVAVLSACPLAMVACDAEGRITACNPAAEQLFGWSSALMLGRPLAPEWIRMGGERSLLARGLAGDAVGGAEFQRRLPGGATGYVRVSLAPVPGEENAHRGFVLVAEDITERRRAEAELEASLARERDAKDAANGARLQMALLSYTSQVLGASFDFLQDDWRTSLTDLGYMIVATVADYCAIDETQPDGTRVRLAEVVSHEMRDLQGAFRSRSVSPDSPLQSRAIGGESILVPDLVEGALDGVCDEEARTDLVECGVRSLLIVPVSARGRTFGTLTLAAFLRSGRRYERADLVFAHELATRMGVALDNVQLYQHSQRAARLREDILAITSHDLRSPLNVISMGTGALLRRMASPGDPSPEYRQLEVIARSATQMQRLVSDLLDLGQIEAGRLAIDPLPHDAGDLVGEALALHAPSAEARGVVLSARVEPGLPTVLADRDRVLQVLANLVGNAIRFTPEGGRITIEARPASQGVQFLVQDSGIGIPESDLERIFGRYQRSGRGGKRNGAGLGLAIVRGIVESHGGTVGVESRQGEGSTFQFSLPPADPH